VPRTPTTLAGGLGMTTQVPTTTVVGTVNGGSAHNSPTLSIQDLGAGDTQDLLIGGENVVNGSGKPYATLSATTTAPVVNYQTVMNQCLAQYIYTYSFALSPEEHQPSGTCNFSRIDNAVLQLDYTGVTAAKSLKVFAVNYNVLRIMSGMGGLAYSN